MSFVQHPSEDDYVGTEWKDHSVVYHTFIAPETRPINHFAFQLKDYQKDGLGWLIKREIDPPHGFHFRGGILADDMGLGKTIQVLSLIACDKFHPERLEPVNRHTNDVHHFTEGSSPLILDLKKSFSDTYRPIPFATGVYYLSINEYLVFISFF